MNPTPKTLLEQLKLPPYLVYGLARRNGRTITVAEIADASGISKRTVSRIAGQLDWAGVTVENASAFCRACGVDPLRTEREFNYMRNTIAQGDKAAYPHLIGKRRKKFFERGAKWVAMKQAA